MTLVLQGITHKAISSRIPSESICCLLSTVAHIWGVLYDENPGYFYTEMSGISFLNLPTCAADDSSKPSRLCKRLGAQSAYCLSVACSGVATGLVLTPQTLNP